MAIARRPRADAVVMAALTLIASVVNYGSNLIFSRVLNPIGYGELTALFALSVVVSVLAGAAQTIIAQRIAAHAARSDQAGMRYLIRYALARLGIVALIAGAVYLAATPVLVSTLGLRHEAVAIALAPVLVLSFVQPLALGVLQGLERFIAYGVMLLAIALSRVVIGVPWAAVERGPGGALLGQAVGMAIVLLSVGWLMRRFIGRRGSGAARAAIRRPPELYAVSASAAFIGFAVLSNLDLVLAKAFLPPREAGVYAALSTLGKIIIFLPAAVSVVMVPNAARARETGSSARVLRISAIAVAVPIALVAVPAVAAPHLVMTIMFGGRYAAAAGGVLPTVVAGGALAMTYLLVVYAVSIGDHGWTWLIGGAIAAQVAGIVLFHGTPTEIATVQAIVALVVLGGNEVLFHPVLSSRAGLCRPVVLA